MAAIPAKAHVLCLGKLLEGPRQIGQLPLIFKSDLDTLSGSIIYQIDEPSPSDIRGRRSLVARGQVYDCDRRAYPHTGIHTVGELCIHGVPVITCKPHIIDMAKWSVEGIVGDADSAEQSGGLIHFLRCLHPGKYGVKSQITDDPNIIFHLHFISGIQIDPYLSHNSAPFPVLFRCPFISASPVIPGPDFIDQCFSAGMLTAQPPHPQSPAIFYDPLSPSHCRS